ITFNAGNLLQDRLAVWIANDLIVRIKLWRHAAGKRISAAKICGRYVGDGHTSDSHAEFHRVMTAQNGSVVLQFVAVFIAESKTCLRAAADEGFEHVEGWLRIRLDLFRVTMDKLKTRLVDNSFGEHSRFR